MPTTLFLNKDYFYTEGYELTLEVNGSAITEGFEVAELLPNHVDIKIIDSSLHGELITIKASPVST